MLALPQEKLDVDAAIVIPSVLLRPETYLVML
jgi:hypothetical protein